MALVVVLSFVSGGVVGLRGAGGVGVVVELAVQFLRVRWDVHVVLSAGRSTNS